MKVDFRNIEGYLIDLKSKNRLKNKVTEENVRKNMKEGGLITIKYVFCPERKSLYRVDRCFNCPNHGKEDIVNCSFECNSESTFDIDKLPENYRKAVTIKL